MQGGAAGRYELRLAARGVSCGPRQPTGESVGRCRGRVDVDVLLPRVGVVLGVDDERAVCDGETGGDAGPKPEREGTLAGWRPKPFTL